MKLKELIQCLTKYYAISITNNSSHYEDQTVVTDKDANSEVETLDFYEDDDGSGERLVVRLK